MKKMFGTKLALLLAAAVLAAGAFTACSNGSDGGGNDGGLGGHIGENPFKGLTLVYDPKSDTDIVTRDVDITRTYKFTEDTKGIYREEWDYVAHTKTEDDFEYAVDSTKGLLKLKFETYTQVSESSGSATTDPKVTVRKLTIDEWFAETFGSLGLDSETKSLIYASAKRYEHYKFAEDRKSVEMTSDYYSGNMAECDASFYLYDYESRFELYFGRNLWFDIWDGYDWHSYNGFPKFSGNTFTAVIFERNFDNETDKENYKKLSTKLEGTYQISGTGTNCKGTVTFTKLPDEFKEVIKTNVSYNVAQEDYGYTRYTVVKQ